MRIVQRMPELKVTCWAAWTGPLWQFGQIFASQTVRTTSLTFPSLGPPATVWYLWNVRTAVGWIILTFVSDFRVPHRISCKNFGDPMTFPPSPPICYFFSHYISPSGSAGLPVGSFPRLYSSWFRSFFHYKVLDITSSMWAGSPNLLPCWYVLTLSEVVDCSSYVCLISNTCCILQHIVKGAWPQVGNLFLFSIVTNTLKRPDVNNRSTNEN